MHRISTAPRFAVIVLGLLAAACSNSTGPGETVGHTELSIEGVTYQWPYDGSKDIGNPAEWNHSAFIPNRIWNETIGKVSSIKLLPDSGYFPVHLGPATPKRWTIGLDGTDLPLTGGERFEKTEDHGTFVIGKGVGPGIVQPSTIAIFKGENSAYATCRPPSGSLPQGFCILLLNDRGVQHTLPFSWGKWSEAPVVLKLYRSLVGIPPQT